MAWEAILSQIFQVGDLVEGRYRILNPLGSGGMGGVYLAEQLGFGRQVALKVLHHQSADDTVSRERFTREARAVCHLKHPNLVVYHDFGTERSSGRLYLAMEYLQGRSLADLLSLGRPIPMDRVVHIFVQLCGALKEAHQAGVIHRDLKPSNVMLVRRAEDGDFVKLIDFGISRVLSGNQQHGQSDVELTETGMIIGTTGYLAPEYIQSQIVDQRTDIYALGVMTYEMIAGQRPFRGTDRVQVLFQHLNDEPTPLAGTIDGRTIPPGLSQAVLKALAKDPEHRYKNVSDFETAVLEAAEPLLGDASIGQTMRHQTPVPRTEFTESFGIDETGSMAEQPTIGLPSLSSVNPLSTEPTLSTEIPGTGASKPTVKRVLWAAIATALVGLTLFWVWNGTYNPSSQPDISSDALNTERLEFRKSSASEKDVAMLTSIEQPAGSTLIQRRPPAPEKGAESYAVESVFVAAKKKPKPSQAKTVRSGGTLDSLLQRAKTAKVNGDWSAVIRAYKSAYKRSPSSRYLKQIGMAHIKLGNRTEACRYFQRFVRRTPSSKRPDVVERLAVYGCELSL